MTVRDWYNFLGEIVLHPVHGVRRVTSVLKNGTSEQRWSRIRREILAWPEHEKKKYQVEIEWLQQHEEMEMYPYDECRQSMDVFSGYDADARLPYVLHNGRRLYYRASIRNVAESYAAVVNHEGILGTGCLSVSPHSYVNDYHFVEDGDVVCDVGCAEALFALDSIDKAARVFCFEVEQGWIKPLRMTFAPFEDKVTIVNKLVSDVTGPKTIRLLDAVDVDALTPCFIKMDIEGWEKVVLEASRDFLTSHRVKLSCCLYHRQSDEYEISSLLRECGFSVGYSEGYMLPIVNEIRPPYFRRGMVYARNF